MLPTDKSEFQRLSEHQNASFDADYHSPDELSEVIASLTDMFGTRGPASILDVGGGNGHFMDALLNAFPNAHGTLVEISPHLLSQNLPSNKKTLIEGSAEHLDTLLEGKRFDVITFNWVLHHLVGTNHRASTGNIVSTLMSAKRHMTRQRAVIIVSENMFDGFFGSNVPSRIIWAITSVRFGPWVRVARKAFNTAGVGVCFQSRRRWRRLFGSAQLVPRLEFGGKRLYGGMRLKLLPLLGISSVTHRHFFLEQQSSQQIQ